jgi:hypothetical protein
MNLLQRALIEKAGHDNGFEHVLPSAPVGWVALGSAHHLVEVLVQEKSAVFAANLARYQASLPEELTRSFPEFAGDHHPRGNAFVLPTEAALAGWLRRAAALAHALPTQAMSAFDVQVQAALAELEPATASSTEVQRLVRQRVGQQTFRHAMLDYWDGACAITGMAVPQALRASHAKAWALCATDAERLDVYNGFLLSANLDALFDSYLISFDSAGLLAICPTLSADAREELGLAPGMRLRWVAQQHMPYLAFHRAQCGWFKA